MTRKTMDIVIVALLIAAIAMSSFSIFIHYSGSNDNDTSVNANDSIRSIIEITCWDDDSDKVCGTGFIIEHDGTYILTNSHMVVREKDGVKGTYANIIAKFANNEPKYELNVVRYDPDKDIALLSFKDDVNVQALKLQTERPAYGDNVTVIGNALGYGLSVKECVVSVPEINIVNNGVTKNTVMISMTINHGDSGAPILNEKGEVIGMCSFKLKDDGKTVEGMSYGLTAKTIADFLNSETSSNS